MNEQVCTRCLMDTTCTDIDFDDNGVCSFCRAYERYIREHKDSDKFTQEIFDETIAAIKKDGEDKEYDCVAGVSGGVDSSYIALRASQLGLRVLCIHVDNGWDTVIANKNIERLVKRLDFTLHTDVLDWEEFKDIQRSFFKASVVDIELITDQALFACIFRECRKHDLHYVLGGYNPTCEASCFMPRGWNHEKLDVLNIFAIQNRFGEKRIDNYPILDPYTYRQVRFHQGLQMFNILEFEDFNHAETIELLKSELGWEEYGGKHCESMFTKYYQHHILPTKFNVDKRKVFYSNMIMAGEMTRDKAIEKLNASHYSERDLRRDTAYIIKKLGFTKEEFEEIMNAP
ncbi:N-acetyl sugar amidotransferase, partial [Pseudodesulfovibrio sp.]|nr:N-acetyl sugar amidotransferase [Pseudodesulfovibrio sp.]